MADLDGVPENRGSDKFWVVKARSDEHESWSGTPRRFSSEADAQAYAKELQADGWQAYATPELPNLRAADVLAIVYRVMNGVGSDFTSDDESKAYRELYDLLEAYGFDMSDVTPYE